MKLHRSNHQDRRAFTLIELLVVMGLIALLAGLLLPMIFRSLRQGYRTRQAADLNTIAIALEAYKQDFGDYPRLPISAIAPNVGDPIPDTGAATLGKALLGPYGDGKVPPANTADDPDDPPNYQSIEYRPGQAVRYAAAFWVCVRTTTAAPSTPDWAPMDPRDGLDGPGFRSRQGGKTWGPYLKPENFKVQGLDLCDRDGNPILYFPATPGGSNVNKANGYVAKLNRTAATPAVPLYNANDNVTIFRRPSETGDDEAVTRIQCICGDYSGSSYAGPEGAGAVGSNQNWGQDTAFAPKTFILWAAGPDGLYGPTNVINNASSTSDWLSNSKATEMCDDVTNFR
jgi:prepilin-type N-terminal cleavage/methylation domain-containing protein